MDCVKDDAFLNPDTDFAYIDEKVDKLLGRFRKFFNCPESEKLGKAILDPRRVKAPGFQTYIGPLYGAQGSFLPKSKDTLSYFIRPLNTSQPQSFKAHETNNLQSANGRKQPNLLPVNERLLPHVSNVRKDRPSQPETRIPVRYDDIYGLPCHEPSHGENKRGFGHESNTTCLKNNVSSKTILEMFTSVGTPDKELQSPLPDARLNLAKKDTVLGKRSRRAVSDLSNDEPRHEEKKRRVGHGSDRSTYLKVDVPSKTILQMFTSIGTPEKKRQSPLDEVFLKMPENNTVLRKRTRKDVHDLSCDKPKYGEKRRKVGNTSSFLKEDEHLRAILEDLTSFWIPDAELHSPIPENLLKQKKMNLLSHEGSRRDRHDDSYLMEGKKPVSNAIKRPSLMKPKCSLPKIGANPVKNDKRSMPISSHQRAAPPSLKKSKCSLPRTGVNDKRSMLIPSYQRAAPPNLEIPKCSLPRNGADPVRNDKRSMPIPSYQRPAPPSLIKPKCYLPRNGADSVINVKCPSQN